ncbi:uncharacterized protein EAE97_004295 [Botrytis byssoidea]|uniref:Major facilitator superfamily (MFS) profile domain-containing protein n=1 Tax=Botrytis byssoidea TaxID=139641 RepID=A0A9P5IMD4_9HELO|nr:uncharacterized protein EAE97_004295 [Botrytis byssoidea]KAF7947046.1 hypothetical protein EAE97_004295 [Botrytis byssoidea]
MVSTTKSDQKEQPEDRVSSSQHLEQATDAERLAATNRVLNDPLASYDENELEELAEAYARKHGLNDSVNISAFKAGALLAKDSGSFRARNELSRDEIDYLDKERTSKWSLPSLFIKVILLCSVCAAVQGVDESVVNGAQIFYARLFGIDDENSSLDPWLLGITNGAPYLGCAIAGCWLTVPFNNWWGRRGTIFVTCLVSALTCFWQAFTNTWWHMFIARFMLGIGLGAKSATVPVYACETSPASIRGAMAMQWQVFTAFGIMLGFAFDLAFYYVPDTASNIHGLNWRLMMGSAGVPALFVCFFVFYCPESPRWYMGKGRHPEAYQAMCRIRHTKVQAARDVFQMHMLLEAEKNMGSGQNHIKQLFTVPRIRRAMVASEITMFMQQFCGINVIAYYSSVIFVDAGFSEVNALCASLGFGMLNFLEALPAIWTIDKFGRRWLLLFTFPLMSIFLFMTGWSFLIPEGTTRIAIVALGIYLFCLAYSPGAGPVPFTYSAEAYPLHVRSLGMSLATATTWFFNFVLAITWPSMLRAFKAQGAFSFYAGFNVVGFFLTLLFVPETKNKTLEELDQVFNVPTRKHAAYGWSQFTYPIRRHVLRMNVERPSLYESLAQENNHHYSPTSSMRAGDRGNSVEKHA